jgi:hypothetical protein
VVKGKVAYATSAANGAAIINHNPLMSNVRNMAAGTRSKAFAVLLVLLIPLVPLASADAVRITSANDSIISQTTWSEVKVIANAFDSSNATASYLEANRCNGGSATCTSGQTSLVLELELDASSNTTRVDVRWATEAPDGTVPPDSTVHLKVLDSTTGWSTVQTDTTIAGLATQHLSEISIDANKLDASNRVTLRFYLYHNGTAFASDELAVYLYGVYDVRSEVVVQSPSISYPNGPFTFTKDVAIASLTPSNTGGAATSWQVSAGALPSGLSLDGATGIISGTPDAVASSSTVTIEATNAGGSDTADLVMEVVDAAPSISYPNGPFTFTKDVAIASLTPSNTGGAATSWQVSAGALPSGLSLDGATGVISGTPDAVASSSTVTIEATNAGGSDTADLVMEVVGEGFQLDLFVFFERDDLSFFENSSLPLPAGCSLSGTNGSLLQCLAGSIAGRAEVNESIVAARARDSENQEYDWAAVIPQTGEPVGTIEPDPFFFKFMYQYDATTWQFIRGSVIIEQRPRQAIGFVGQANAWEVDMQLPYGLVINPSDGTVSGLPTNTTPVVIVSITASNALMNQTIPIVIQIEEPAPIFTYPQSAYTLTVGAEIEPIVPYTNPDGGPATYWSLTGGMLPDGLSLDPSSGTITGTPAAPSVVVSYFVVAKLQPGAEADGTSDPVELRLSVVNPVTTEGDENPIIPITTLSLMAVLLLAITVAVLARSRRDDDLAQAPSGQVEGEDEVQFHAAILQP